MIFKVTSNELTGWLTCVRDGDLNTLVCAPTFEQLMGQLNSQHLWDKVEKILA